MESKGVFFILIIVIAILTLSLAALAGYIFIVQGNSDNDKESIETAKVDPDIPAKEDRIVIQLFDKARTFNLKNKNSDKVSVIQANVALDCHKVLANNKKAVVTDIIANYGSEIQELVVRFFLEKTIDDVKNTAVMDEAKAELEEKINNLLNEGVKKPEDIVYKVIFSEWIFM